MATTRPETVLGDTAVAVHPLVNCCVLYVAFKEAQLDIDLVYSHLNLRTIKLVSRSGLMYYAYVFNKDMLWFS